MFSKITRRHLLSALFVFSQVFFLDAQSNWERDAAFGPGGVLRIGGGREQERIGSMAVLPDGKILAAGRYGDDHSFILVRYLPNGQIDPTFGQNGKTYVPVSPQPDHAREIIVMADGRFMLGVNIESFQGAGVFGLMRFMPDGQPDNSFGINGLVTSNASPDLDHHLNSIARQPDGKILVAGATNLDSGDESEQSVTLYRFTTAGYPDNSFGFGGMVRLTYPGEKLEFNAVDFLSDGRIVAAGSNADRIIVARFMNDGGIDSTFGVDGVKFLQYSAAGKTRCEGVRVLPDEKVLLGAWCTEYWLNNGAIAIRLQSNGSLDPDFHNNGMSFIHCSYQLNATSMALQSDGKMVIVAAGLDFDPAPATAVFRFRADGAPDSSFAQYGAWVSPIGQRESALYTVWPLAGGKILAAGAATHHIDMDFALLRLGNDGVPDAGFGQGGLVCTDFGWGHDRPAFIRHRPEDKVLLASNAQASAGYVFVQEKCALDQFLSDGSHDPGFGNNGRDSFPGGNIKSLIFQPDGKILVGTDAYWDGQNKPAALFRRLATGGADSSFHHNGRVDSLFSPHNSTNLIQIGVLTSGKIIVAGSALRPGTSRDYILTCLTPDGSRDSSFGVNGFVLVDYGNKLDEVFGMLVRPDDRILLAGTSWNAGAGEKDVVFLQFFYEGTPDHNWGQNGVVFADYQANVEERVTAMTSSPDGKLLVAAELQQSADDSQYDHLVARYLPDGSPDPAFGSAGKTLLPIAGPHEALRDIRQIQLLSAGRFATTERYFASQANTDSFAVRLQRFNANGVPDTGFAAVDLIADSYGPQFDHFTFEFQPDAGVLRMAGSNIFDADLNRDIHFAQYRTSVSCLPLVVETAAGKRLDGVDVSILPTKQLPDCQPNLIKTQCDDATLCLCGKDSLIVVPYRNDNPLNGVSTYDMVLMSRHILGIEALNSPFKIIAADVNQSKSVTTFDIVETRKLILGIYQNLPNTSSWRFVRQDYVFPNPANPFAHPFPERDTLIVFDPASRSAFRATKTGDVNESHFSACDNFGSGAEARNACAFTGVFCPAEAGAVFSVPITLACDLDCAAWQAGLRFDPEILELLAAEPLDMEGLTSEHFGLARAPEGELRVLWFSEEGRSNTIPAGKKLFNLVFRAKKAVSGKNLLAADDTVLECRAFDANGTPQQLTFEETAPCPQTAAGAWYVAPNPATATVCLIPGAAAQAGEWLVWDPKGRLVARRNTTGQGTCLPEAATWPAGLYSWRFSGADGATETGKFLKQ